MKRRKGVMGFSSSDYTNPLDVLPLHLLSFLPLNLTDKLTKGGVFFAETYNYLK